MISPSEAVNQRLEILLEAVSDELGEEDHDIVAELIWAGEPTVSLEQLSAALVDRRVRVSKWAWEEIVRLGKLLGADDSFWSDLEVQK